MNMENEEKIIETEKRIMEVVKGMGINRMPSCSEVMLFTGGHSLANRIIRSGGFKKWAERLNLKLQNCETYFADKYEQLTEEFLKQIFTTVNRMPTRFPYDILINNRTKIDVKASRIFKGKTGYFYKFNLESKYPKSDFYVVYCVGDNDETQKVLVIPSSVMSGHRELSIGIHSKYDKYIDKWDLIEMHDRAMKDIAG